MSLPFIPYPKSAQVIRKRTKPTAAQRGHVNASTRKKLKERSQGLCERCGVGGQPLQAAHLIRRWRIEGKTTVNDIAHLCIDCHRFCDNTAPGRHWLIEFRNRLLEETKWNTECGTS